MAHIPDGVLAGEVLAAGAAAAALGVAWGLKSLEPARIPQVAVLSAVFFVASLVHFPVGPTSVHLMLGGLAGIALGAAAFPAILVALALQAVLFGYGGLLPLGVNLVDMAVPAVLAGLAFARFKSGEPRRDGLLAGALAASAVLGTAALVAAALALSGREFLPAAALVVPTYLPVAAIEAVFTAAAVGLLARVRPGMLAAGAGAVLLFAAPPAEAHRLKLFAAVEGDAVTGMAYFAGGGAAVDVAGRLLNPDGSEAAGFRTDAEGRFAVTPKARQDYLLAVDAGDGHAATFKLAAAELPHGLPPGQASAPVADAVAPAPELARLVEEAVARQVRPLREQLDAYEARVRLHDVLGGIGTILGVFGLAAFLAARRQR